MKRFVGLRSIPALIFVAIVSLLSLSGCHDWPEGDVISSSPLWGRWTLERIGDIPVGSGNRIRYEFRQDPDNRTLNSGIGECQRYDAGLDKWVCEPVKWTVESSTVLTIRCDGVVSAYYYLLEVGSSRTTLKLYDESSANEQIFVKDN